MQILRPQRLLRETPVMSPKVAVEEPVRFLTSRDTRQSHLFNQAVLKRSKGPPDPALGLRRVGRDDFYPQLTQRSLKLRLSVFIPQQFVGRRVVL